MTCSSYKLPEWQVMLTGSSQCSARSRSLQGGEALLIRTGYQGFSLWFVESPDLMQHCANISGSSWNWQQKSKTPTRTMGQWSGAQLLLLLVGDQAAVLEMLAHLHEWEALARRCRAYLKENFNG